MTFAGQSAGLGDPGEILRAALEERRATLSEFEAKKLLTSYGIVVPRGELVADADQAVEAARRAGYPVVLKGVSTTIRHKTEAGLVRLDVHDEAAVRSCCAALLSAPGADVADVLVEHQLPRQREFMAGMIRDPQFGPVVMFGLGGILAEALDDVAFAVAPLTEADALMLARSIRSSALLGSYRGLPPVDSNALAGVLCAIGRLAVQHPEIAEMDLNPLLIDGGIPVAADCLVTLASPADEAFAGGGIAESAGPKLYAHLPALDALYAPQSVAIVGASSDPSKWGGTILVNLVAGGYPGKIYPVTLNSDQVMGMKSYPSVSAIPGQVDVALVAVPKSAARRVVDECGRKGVRAVVMVSAGFSETGSQGAGEEEEIAKLAASYRMALIGPNCMGVVSAWTRFYGVGAIHLHPKPGPAAFVSQSGNVGVQLMRSAELRGGGVGSFVGTGNEALFHTADMLDYLKDDPRAGMVAAYVEGYEDGRRLLESAQAVAAKKPMVMLRAAVSDYGRRAAASHTGALAGSRRVFEGAARQAGIVVTYDPDEFLDLSLAFSYLPLPKGDRVAIITMGGGWGVLSADEVARSGLRLAEFDRSLIGRLDALLPAFWSRGNPVDLVATLVEGAAESVVEQIISSDSVDALIVSGVISVYGLAEEILVEAGRLQEKAVIRLREEQPTDPAVFAERRERFIRRLIELMEHYEKPIVSVAAVPQALSVFPDWGKHGVVVIQSPLRAVRVLAKMVEYGMRR